MSIGQRLVRILCDACKEPHKPKPEFLKKANLPVEKVDVFYRGVPEIPSRSVSNAAGPVTSDEPGQPDGSLEEVGGLAGPRIEVAIKALIGMGHAFHPAGRVYCPRRKWL